MPPSRLSTLLAWPGNNAAAVESGAVQCRPIVPASNSAHQAGGGEIVKEGSSGFHEAVQNHLLSGVGLMLVGEM